MAGVVCPPGSACHTGWHSLGEPPQRSMPRASYAVRRSSNVQTYIRPPATTGGEPTVLELNTSGVVQASLRVATLPTSITLSPPDAPVCAAPPRYMGQSHPAS